MLHFQEAIRLPLRTSTHLLKPIPTVKDVHVIGSIHTQTHLLSLSLLV
jgi:hypothetical protein